jgi:nitroreductase
VSKLFQIIQVIIKIRIITNQEMIAATLEIQGGFNGYKLPPALPLITTDNRNFTGPSERNQGYTDGGLFSMAFMMSLEYVGLAACALNAMFSKNKEMLMREVLEIPLYENLIMFIAIGNFLEETPYPKSWRKGIKDVLMVVE